MIWTYQNTYYNEEGVLKLASYIHISSAPVVSTLHAALRYFLPMFFVIQNYKLAPIVTIIVAVIWGKMSAVIKISRTTTALAMTNWNKGDLVGLYVEPSRLSMLGWYITDAIINYTKSINFLSFSNTTHDTPYFLPPASSTVSSPTQTAKFGSTRVSCPFQASTLSEFRTPLGPADPFRQLRSKISTMSSETYTSRNTCHSTQTHINLLIDIPQQTI